MIMSISDRKDMYFHLIGKVLFNKIKFSMLKNGIVLYFEWHFHEFLEYCDLN